MDSPQSPVLISKGKVISFLAAPLLFSLWFMVTMVNVLCRRGWALLKSLPGAMQGWMEEKVERLLGVFEPEPEPPRIQTMFEAWETSVVIFIEAARNFAVSKFPVVVATVVVVALLLSAVLLMRKSFVRVAMQLRGIQFEAMRQGSIFVKMDCPAYQVAVMEPGLLADSHIGYGIRAGNYLVTPMHVVEKRDSILLSTARGKVVVPVNLVKSRIVVDLVYVYVHDKAWSMLGVSQAKLAQAHHNGFATCVGIQGGSTGLLRKAIIKGLLVYSGSTVPGMSGAAYEMQGVVVGVHTGVVGEHNMGVSALALRAELSAIVKGESSPDIAAAAGRYVADNLSKKLANWDEELLRAQASERWAQDDWNDYQEIDYEQKFDWGEAAKVEQKPVLNLEVPRDLFSNTIKVKAQGVEGDNLTYDLLTPSHLRDVENLKREVASLKERVSSLEEVEAKKKVEYLECDQCSARCRTVEALDKHKAASHSGQKSEVVYLQCTQCPTKAKTEEALSRHVQESHKPLIVCQCGKKMRGEEVVQKHKCALQGESAQPDIDTGKLSKMVKQGPFLGQRSKSPTRITKSLPKSSSSKKRSSRSRSREDNPSDVKESLKSIEQLLRQVLLTTAGPSSAMQQK